MLYSLFKKSFPAAHGRFTVPGIDVSGHQAPNIVQRLDDVGLVFEAVSIKCSEGASYFSEEGIAQHDGAVERGKAPSLYHWISYRTSPSAEFANLLRSVERIGLPEAKPAQPIVMWLDAEDTNYARHVTSDYTSYTMEVAELFTEYFGVAIGIYSAGWWSNGRLSSAVNKYPLWVADYDDNRIWSSYSDPIMPSAWNGHRAVAWQWTSSNPATGNLDLDMLDPIEMALAAERQFPNIHPSPKQEANKGVTEMHHILLVAEGEAKGAVLARFHDGSVRPIMNEEYEAFRNSIPVVPVSTTSINSVLHPQ